MWAFVQSGILHRFNLNWQTSLVDSFISAGLLAFFCLDVVAIFYFYQPSKENRVYRFVFAFGLAILYSITVKWVLQNTITAPTYNDFLEKSMPLRSMFALLMLLFVTAISWLWYNLLEQNESEKRRSDMEQLAKEAELAKLRQQLQPHFLFNSLNSISALAGSKPNDARKMIQQLSDFLRGTLKKDEETTVLLLDEIEHLKLYLDIEKVRFGYRLNVEMFIPEETLSTHIPPLLIQPIVENAIKFGLYGTTDEITITITTQLQHNMLCVIVKNPYDASVQLSGKGTGFGLSSVKRRLFLLYARNDLMITENDNQLFVTTLKIPQTTTVKLQ